LTLLRDARLHETLVSLLILAGSYLGARFVSFLFGKFLAQAARRSASTLDDRLIAALKRPVTYALFLAGAYAAIQRSPLPPPWAVWLDDVFFVLAVLLLTLAVVRSYGILLGWYATDSKIATASTLAVEFAPLFSKIGTVVIVMLASIALLKHFGQDVSSLVVSLGVGSLAIGLAAQDTLANMFAGITLMLDRPFKIGDRIQLATGEIGDVELVGMRVTRIRTVDETVLIVPNSLLVKDRLVNQTRPTRHITTRVDVGVAYGSDLAQVRRILAEAAQASHYVDRERPPLVLVTRFADFSINLRVVFWAKDYTEQALAASEVHEAIYARLREAGIEIPFPVRRVLQEVVQ
jgi:small-conductance mechanosensitive channel